ncbi:hypothetical protein F5Y19DRAFT_487383 [Xylariaceae sp. FL1651]|nr:hypothetical protein F5Y19DRAFT_487383 [Xylariaceae sp. FL1651]
MRIPTIEAIARWPKPNYVDPETRAPIGIATGSTLFVFITFILAIRLYSRKRLTGGFGLDDTLICLAYVPTAAFAITGLATEDLIQWDRHIWDVEPKFFNSQLATTLSLAILFDLATSLTKLSMLALVRRLTAASNNRIEKIAVLAVTVLIGINCFIFIVVKLFQCTPMSASWTIFAEPSQCINEKIHMMSANIINTITDFVVVLLPIRTVMTLQLPPRQHIIVMSLFGVGLVASFVGIARTYFTWLLYTAADYDTTWNAWSVWLSSLIELHLGIICASIPATKPFFLTHLPNMINATQRRQKSLLMSATQATGDE